MPPPTLNSEEPENASEFAPPSCLLRHFGSNVYHRPGDVVGRREPRTPRLTAERRKVQLKPKSIAVYLRLP